MTTIDPKIKTHNGISVGDMVTTYNKGYFKVIGFAPYNNHLQGQMQCFYVRVANSLGSPTNNKTVLSCHIDFCDKITFDILEADRDAEIAAAVDKYSSLYDILKKMKNNEVGN